MTCPHCATVNTLHPASEYHEDYGNVLWWRLPVEEPPWVGTTLDDDYVDDYYTHWSHIPTRFGT